MKTKTTQTQLAVAILSAGLLAMSPEAGAQLQNRATYSVTLSGVQSPNTSAAYFPGASGDQASYSYSPYLTPPVPVGVAGSANTGTNANGLGYAVGHGFARAEAGVLKASALAEAQAVPNPTTNVGASAVVSAQAKFTDLATFTSTGHYQNLLIVSGNLLLTGDMYGGGYAQVKVGGTGLNPQSAYAEWRGWGNQQQSATGVYSSWVPGSDVSIPFSFTTYSGQAMELGYWLDVYASAGTASVPCVDSLGGGLCDVVQPGYSIANADYSHTLAWGGVTVTDWYGTPVNFSVSSKSGFDYAVAYSAPVPEPEIYAMLLAGLGLLGFTARRRKQDA